MIQVLKEAGERAAIIAAERVAIVRKVEAVAARRQVWLRHIKGLATLKHLPLTLGANKGIEQ